jgi:Outer membrane lipoprotein-sorting protein
LLAKLITLVNERFFSFVFQKFFLFFAFIFFSFSILSANEKNQIITQLNNLDSLEFTFNQIINEKTEKGSCLLLFPGKLKCEYFDKKQKELVINNKKLAITQKRYNKTYYYPISKSPFLNILYKDKLLEIVKSGELKLTDKLIKLIYLGENEITVLFDKNTLDLKGWNIVDQYNNNINFSLNIVAKNDSYKSGTFKIPKIN